MFYIYLCSHVGKGMAVCITFLSLDMVFGRKQTCPFFSKNLKHLILISDTE